MEALYSSEFPVFIEIPFCAEDLVFGRGPAGWLGFFLTLFLLFFPRDMKEIRDKEGNGQR